MREKYFDGDKSHYLTYKYRNPWGSKLQLDSTDGFYFKPYSTEKDTLNMFLEDYMRSADFAFKSPKKYQNKVNVNRYMYILINIVFKILCSK
jgi:hypothetical protein